MGRIGRWFIALAVVALVLVGFLYRHLTRFTSVRVTDDVHMIDGQDGPLMVSSNVAVVRTAAGPVVVDTMTFPFHGRLIQRMAARLAPGEVQAVINTHYHQDHTHGNPAFRAGTEVVATERTRSHLLARDAAYWEGAAARLLPNRTFAHDHDLTIGGKTLRAKFLGRGHTDGDLVVLVEEDRVLVMGDLLFHRHYPNIDLEAGGSIPAWIATLDRVLELDFDHAIPGHGAVTDREGVRAFQRFLRELWEVSQAAARAGRSLEETIASARLTTDAGFTAIGIPGYLTLDRDFVLRRGWEEATGTVGADGR